MAVDTWIFKIDDENNGRGIASFQVDSIREIKNLRKSNEQSIDSNFLKTFSEIIAEKLPKKLKIVVKSLYPTYKAYLQDFIKKGGIIEA